MTLSSEAVELFSEHHGIHFSLQGLAQEWGVAGAAAERFIRDGRFSFRVKHHQIGRSPFFQGDGGQPHQPAGSIAAGAHHRLPGHFSRFHQILVNSGQERIQRNHALRGDNEILKFGKRRAGRVIGNNAVNGAVIHGGNQGIHIRLVAQGRQRLVAGIVPAHVLMREQEMVKRRFRAQPGGFPLAAAQDIHAAGRRDGLHMQGVARIHGKADDGFQPYFLRTGGGTHQPQTVGSSARVHGRPGRQGRHVSAQGESKVQIAGVLHGAVQQQHVVRSTVPVRDETDALGAQGVVGGLLFPAVPLGQATGGDNLHQSIRPAYFHERGNLGGIVHHGFGIRHRHQSGHSSMQGGGGSRSHTFLVLPAGLAQMGMDVKQAGQNKLPGSIQRLFRGALQKRSGRSFRCNHPPGNQKVRRGGTVRQPGVANKYGSFHEQSVLGLRSEMVKDGHAAGDAVFHLAVDQAALIVHRQVTDFHAAVDRSRMHDVQAFTGNAPIPSSFLLH